MNYKKSWDELLKSAKEESAKKNMQVLPDMPEHLSKSVAKVEKKYPNQIAERGNVLSLLPSESPMVYGADATPGSFPTVSEAVPGMVRTLRQNQDSSKGSGFAPTWSELLSRAGQTKNSGVMGAVNVVTPAINKGLDTVSGVAGSAIGAVSTAYNNAVDPYGVGKMNQEQLDAFRKEHELDNFVSRKRYSEMERPQPPAPDAPQEEWDAYNDAIDQWNDADFSAGSGKSADEKLKMLTDKRQMELDKQAERGKKEVERAQAVVDAADKYNRLLPDTKKKVDEWAKFQSEGDFAKIPDKMDDLHGKAYVLKRELEKEGVPRDVMDYRRQVYNQKSMESKAKESAEFASVHPLLANANAVIQNVRGAIPAALESAKQAYQYNAGNPLAIDPNSGVFSDRIAAQAVRQQSETNIDNWAKAKGASETTRDFFKFLYNAVTSTADSAAASAVTATRLGRFGSATIIMSGGAAGDTYRQHIEAGDDPITACAMGAADGIIEAITEAVSPENLSLLKNAGDKSAGLARVMKRLAAKGISEGAEEFDAFPLRLMAEQYIEGKDSELNRRINELGGGKEAIKQAYSELFRDALVDAAAGFISGVTFSSVEQTGTALKNGVSNYRNRAKENTTDAPPTKTDDAPAQLSFEDMKKESSGNMTDSQSADVDDAPMERAPIPEEEIVSSLNRAIHRNAVSTNGNFDRRLLERDVEKAVRETLGKTAESFDREQLRNRVMYAADQALNQSIGLFDRNKMRADMIQALDKTLNKTARIFDAVNRIDYSGNQTDSQSAETDDGAIETTRLKDLPTDVGAQYIRAGKKNILDNIRTFGDGVIDKDAVRGYLLERGYTDDMIQASGILESEDIPSAVERASRNMEQLPSPSEQFFPSAESPDSIAKDNRLPLEPHKQTAVEKIADMQRRMDEADADEDNRAEFPGNSESQPAPRKMRKMKTLPSPEEYSDADYRRQRAIAEAEMREEGIDPASNPGELSRRYLEQFNREQDWKKQMADTEKGDVPLPAPPPESEEPFTPSVEDEEIAHMSPDEFKRFESGLMEDEAKKVHYQNYEELYQHLAGRRSDGSRKKIYLPSDAVADAESATGIEGWSKIRAKFSGFLNLTTQKESGLQDLDSFYTGLQDAHPELFPEIAGYGGKLARILEVWDNLRSGKLAKKDSSPPKAKSVQPIYNDALLLSKNLNSKENLSADDYKGSVSVPGLVQNEYSAKIHQRTARILDSLGTKLGVSIELTDKISSYGKYESGRVLINPYAGNPLKAIVSHEITHHLKKASATWAEYEKAVLDFLENSGRKESVRKAIEKSYGKLSSDAEAEEIAANFTSLILNGEAEFESLLGIKRSIAQIIADKLDELVKRFRAILWEGTAKQRENLRKQQEVFLSGKQMRKYADELALISRKWKAMLSNAKAMPLPPPDSPRKPSGPAKRKAGLIGEQGVDRATGNEQTRILSDEAYQAIKEGNISLAYRTIQEKQLLSDADTQRIINSIPDSELTYGTVTNAQRVEDAHKEADKMSTEELLGVVRARSESILSNAKGGELTVLSDLLTIRAAKEKNWKVLKEAVGLAVDLGNTYGRLLQSFSILKRLGGTGQLVMFQRKAQQINAMHSKDIAKNTEKHKAEINKLMKRVKALSENKSASAELKGLLARIAKLKGEVVVTDEMAQRLISAKSDADLAQAVKDCWADLAGQYTPTFWENLNQLRYTAMLFNSRTHFMNITGNTVVIPASTAKGVIAAALEKGMIKAGKLDKDNATKSAYIFKADSEKNQNYLKGVFEENQAGILSDANRIGMDIFRQNIQYFQTDAPVLKTLGQIANCCSRNNSKLLQKEDDTFQKLAFLRAAGGWMKARGLTADTMTDALKNEMVEYASRQSQIEVFHAYSALASAIERAAKTSPAAEIAINGMFPFKKTNINIAKMGIRYSPVGLAGGMYDVLTALKSGNQADLVQAIDNVAMGLTGTGIFLMGVLLSSLGLIRGKLGDDKEDKFLKGLGWQDFSALIGGRSVSLESLSPIAMPLFSGAQCWQMFAEDQHYNAWEFVDALAQLTDPLYEMSFMQGFDNYLQEAATNGASSAMVSIAGDYLNQFVPTILGQIARTIDPYRRNAYYNDKTDSTPYIISKTINKAKSKIPFVAETLPAYVDVWGNKKENRGGNLLGRAVQNFISPFYVSNEKLSRVDDTVLNLYNSVGDTSVIPSTPSKYVTVNGVRRDFSATEYERYSTIRGQQNQKLIKEAISNPQYKKLSDGVRAEVVADIYTYSTEIGKAKLIPGYTTKTKWVQNAKDAQERFGIPVTTYLSLINAAKSMHPTGNLTRDNLMSAGRTLGISSSVMSRILRMQFGK